MEKTIKIRNKYPEPQENYPFDEETFGFLKENKNAINSAANTFGVSPEAIAGAIGDEFNRSSFFDPWQNKFVATFGDLEEVEKNINAGETKGLLSKAKFKHAAQDIGPGNMNVTTLHAMFTDRVENGIKSDKLKAELSKVVDSKASREKQWEQYIEYAITPEGTATLAAAHMEDATKELEAYTEGLSQEEKDAVLVTYYKQGPNYLKKYQDKVGQYTSKKAGADSRNYRPINPGEGVGLLYQINEIRNAIGK